MTTKVRRSGGLDRVRAAAILAAALAPWVASGRAEAQYFPGFGYGFWQYNAPSVGAIEQHSLLAAQAAIANRPGNLSEPRDEYEMERDSGIMNRYETASRRGLDERVGRPRPAPAAPRLPLASFFDPYKQLLWPADAPTTGDLGPKRAACEKAAAKALDEFNRWGSLSIATAAEARGRLVEYGQPALQYVREHSTARVAESFHLFLLSLYESIGQATSAPPRS